MACDTTEPRAVVETPAPRSPSPTERQSRPPIETPVVTIEAPGRVGDRLTQAVEDLQTIDLWDPLTHHLFGVKLDSRSGGANVPDDEHLADAYYTGVLAKGSGGEVCDIMFFPTAVQRDLERWSGYYAAGLISGPPPTLRQFYGALVAHELAHCRRGPRDEPVARAWEERALEALRAAGI